MFILLKRTHLALVTGILTISTATNVQAQGYAVIQGYTTIRQPQSGGFRGTQTNHHPPSVGAFSVPSGPAGGAGFGGNGWNQAQRFSNPQPNGNFGAFGLGRRPSRPMQGNPNGLPGGGGSFPSYGMNAYPPPQTGSRPQWVQRQDWRDQQRQQMVRGRRQPTASQVQGQYPIAVRQSTSQVAPRPPVDVALQYASTSVVVISNPQTNSDAIAYAINGKWYSLKPGSRHEISGSPTWTIEFDRGNDGGRARYTLREGKYKFSKKEQQWSFYRLRTSNVIAQSAR